MKIYQFLFYNKERQALVDSAGNLDFLKKPEEPWKRFTWYFLIK